MNVCWVDDLICRPPDSNVCDREGDFCYRVYRTMSAGCIKMRWSPAESEEPAPVGIQDEPVPVRERAVRRAAPARRDAAALSTELVRYVPQLLDNTK